MSLALSDKARGRASRLFSHRVRMRIARDSARFRVLPDFLIIGAGRSGTTSLYTYLTQHPDVLAAWTKEIGYFDAQYHMGQGWYRARFPLRFRMGVPGTRRRRITGEATPTYLFFPEVPRRVRTEVPAARFIVTLRDPVVRAFSQYRHNCRRGIEPLAFEEALRAEPDRRQAARRLARSHRDDGGSVAVRVPPSFDYVERGMYAAQLERWFELFPRDRFLVIRAEDLFRGPATVYARVLDFLDLASFSGTSFRVWNEGDDAEIPDGARRTLEEVFAEPNDRLQRLVGIDYST